MVIPMMKRFRYIGLCIVLVQLSAAAPNSKITKIHAHAQIQMRYANTKVETQMKNFANEVSEAFFDMYIPNEAFVSNFQMTLKGQTYVGKVDIKK